MANYSVTTPLDVTGTPGVINLKNGAFVMGLQAPSLSGNVDFTLPAITGSAGNYLQKTSATSSTWTAITTFSSSLPITMTYNGNATTGFNIASAVFTTVGYFQYRGSTVDDTPTAARAIVTASVIGMTLNVRIFDETNALTISTATSVSAVAATQYIITFGAISNVPASTARWRVDGNRVAAGTLSIYTVQIFGTP